MTSMLLPHQDSTLLVDQALRVDQPSNLQPVQDQPWMPSYRSEAFAEDLLSLGQPSYHMAPTYVRRISVVKRAAFVVFLGLTPLLAGWLVLMW